MNENSPCANAETVSELYAIIEKGLQDYNSGNVVPFAEGMEIIRKEINGEQAIIRIGFSARKISQIIINATQFGIFPCKIPREIIVRRCLYSSL